jgi:hypothetical protein
MTKSTLAASLRVNLFADRGSDIGAAWQCADDMIASMPDGGSRAAARTALHVLVNTIANAIDDLAPSTIAHADRPDVGIDESRIAHLVDVHMAQWIEDNLDIENQVQEAIDNQDIEQMISETLKNMNFRVDISAD